MVSEEVSTRRQRIYQLRQLQCEIAETDHWRHEKVVALQNCVSEVGWLKRLLDFEARDDVPHKLKQYQNMGYLSDLFSSKLIQQQLTETNEAQMEWNLLEKAFLEASRKGDVAGFKAVLMSVPVHKRQTLLETKYDKDKHQSVKAADPGMTCLHLGASNGHASIVESAITEMSRCLNSQGHNEAMMSLRRFVNTTTGGRQCTPLLLAVRQDSLRSVELLCNGTVSTGLLPLADVTFSSRGEGDPLLWAWLKDGEYYRLLRQSVTQEAQSTFT